MNKTWNLLTVISVLGVSDAMTSVDTWIGSVNSLLDEVSNWTPEEPSQPPLPGDQALFGTATSYTPELNDGTTFSLYEALFTDPSVTYAFQITGSSSLLSFGLFGDTHQELISGVSNTISITNQQSFTVSNDGAIVFYGFSSAAQNSDLNVMYTIGSGSSGSLEFQEESSAGYAKLNIGVSGSGTLNFQDESSAGFSTITVGNTTGSSNIPGLLNFYGSSTAAFSTIQVGDHLGASSINFYSDSDAIFSTAGTSTILVGYTILPTKVVDGVLTFHGYSSAGQAVIIVSDNTGLGRLNFEDQATAASSVITLGDVTNNLLGHAIFSDTATAGSANISIVNGSILEFTSESSGGESVITIGDEGGTGRLYFRDASTASSSAITLGDVTDNLIGHAIFSDTATAGSANISIVNGSILEFTSESSGGESSITLSTTGTLLMGGPSSYSLASLTSDDTSSVVLDEAELTIDYAGSSPIEIAGSISGTGGSLVKAGNGTVILSGSCSYTGLTTLEDGKLIADGSIAGGVLVTGGTLSGTGTIEMGLTANAGVISPGNSPGTMTVIGVYAQSSSAEYLVQIEQDLSSLIETTESAILDNSPVTITLLEGVPNHPYLILETAQGIIGTFATPSLDSTEGINEKLLSGNISYQANTKAFLTLQTTFENVARTVNQRSAAQRLDSLTNPNEQETVFLNDLVQLNTGNARRTLEQLSGEPYVNWLFMQEIINQRFLSNLYEPLRTEISSFCKRCPEEAWTIWTDGGVGRSFLDSSQGIKGLRINSYEASLGAHKKIIQGWTIGIAGNYGHDRTSYKIGGEAKSQSWLGGLYSLYRPNTIYLLMDFISGYSQNKVKRVVDGNNETWTASGKARVSQFGFYAELGFDLLAPYVLFQPFFGLGGEHYHLGKMKERGTYPTALSLSDKNRNTANSSLGVHITGFPDSCFGLFGIDCVWHCSLTSQDQRMGAQFQAFGDSFTLSGVQLQRNSVESAVFMQTTLTNCFNFFVKASGQKWGRASTYNGLIGVEASW